MPATIDTSADTVLLYKPDGKNEHAAFLIKKVRAENVNQSKSIKSKGREQMCQRQTRWAKSTFSLELCMNLIELHLHTVT